LLGVLARAQAGKEKEGGSQGGVRRMGHMRTVCAQEGLSSVGACWPPVTAWCNRETIHSDLVALIVTRTVGSVASSKLQIRTLVGSGSVQYCDPSPSAPLASIACRPGIRWFRWNDECVRQKGTVCLTRKEEVEEWRVLRG
jgi:hypothetical protein